MVEKLVSLCDDVFDEVERKVDDKVEGDFEVKVKVSLCDDVFDQVEGQVEGEVEVSLCDDVFDKVEGKVEVKVSLCDNVFDEVEGKGEDHCGVLFCADAVQGLGEVGGQDCDDRGEEYGTMAMVVTIMVKEYESTWRYRNCKAELL